MTRILDDVLLGALLCVLGFGSCSACDTAQAQDPPAAASQNAADVARCLVAESSRAQDWPAILDVLERRAARGGMSVATMARRYCAVHRAARPSLRQARIRALPEGGTPRLQRLYQRALVAVQRGGPGRCDAEHWGAASGDDLARALRLGWRRVNCGDTANAFWRLH
jgi:hypothetical protein